MSYNDENKSRTQPRPHSLQKPYFDESSTDQQCFIKYKNKGIKNNKQVPVIFKTLTYNFYQAYVL
jgi:hypothetical protein